MTVLAACTLGLPIVLAGSRLAGVSGVGSHRIVKTCPTYKNAAASWKQGANAN